LWPQKRRMEWGPPPGMRSTPEINATTRLCAVYGHPVKHSASPAFQNAGMEALGLDWRYAAFDVRPEELGAAIAGAAAMRFAGLNLTVPHKLLALEMVDELDESAWRWGAVNTIRFDGRGGPEEAWRPMRECDPLGVAEVRSVGFNTDADAIARSIEEDLGLELAGSSALLLGAGGAGRAAALKLASAGVARLHLANRTMAKAEELASEIRAGNPGLECAAGFPGGGVDLVLNATSLGLKAGDGLPLDAGVFPLARARFAYDMIYRPSETPFLRAAKEAGLRTANGMGMLLHQGAAALEIWTGMEAPVEVMRGALRRHLYGEGQPTGGG